MSPARPLPSLSRSRSVAGLVLVVSLAASATPAQAAQTKVSGKVKGGAGMTVAAMSPQGSAVRAKLKGSGAFRFSLKSGRGTTLQLFRKNGSYFGPIVLASRASKGYSALSSRSISVGTVSLKKGYASTRKAVDVKKLDAKTYIRLDGRGAPTGAGRHGIVAKSKKSVTARAAQDGGGDGGGGGDSVGGGDSDRDGIPAGLDLDSNGNGRLDNFDTNARPTDAGFFAGMQSDMRAGLNVNASGVDQAVIDRTLAGDNVFNLGFYINDGILQGAQATAAHVDCGELVYCRRGNGTATTGSLADAPPGVFPPSQRWTDYSPDGSGFPNLVRFAANGGNVYAMPIQPHATSAQMRPGDTYDVVFNTQPNATHLPATLGAYFVTTPALATVNSLPVPYPVDDTFPGVAPHNPLVLPSGRLTLTAWRPQRQAVPGAETGGFRDQGNLNYGVIVNDPSGRMEYPCAGHYSALSDTLTESSDGNRSRQLAPLVDSAGDAAPDRARTIGMTVDIGACLRANGASSVGDFNVTLSASGEPRSGGMDRAAQAFFTRIEG